jgi:hypothetical protein
MTTTDTALTVIWRRNACGAAESLEIWRGRPDTDNGYQLLDTAACSDPDAALEDILWNARQYYRCDPMDDTLPPDHAVLAMYEDHIA